MGDFLSPMVARSRVLALKCTCTRRLDHIIHILFVLDEKTAIKVGQFPSSSDILFEDLKRFRKVTSEQRLKELRRAINLASYDVGIGAFVYLRRVFEGLLEDHRKTAEKDGLVFSDWNSKRVADRVQSLSEYLPDLLLQAKGLYSVLSKGVHELSEEECLSYFATLRDTIFLLLEHDEQIRARREMENNLKQSIQEISISKT